MPRARDHDKVVKMTKQKILKAFLVMAVLLAAISTYFAQGDRKQAGDASSSAAPRTEAMRQQMIDEQLRTLLAPVGVSVPEIGPVSQAQYHQELLVRWQPSDKSPATNANGETQQQPIQPLTVMGHTNRTGRLQRQRALELSEEQVLVIGVGADEAMRWWTLIADPRLRRAEMPGPDGELSGQSMPLSETDFAVSYPADASITELRFYHPHWTGTRFTLESIGSAAVR
jgi:hypothetical protein